MRAHDLGAARVFLEDLIPVERRTNHEIILEYILERRPIRYRGRY